MTSFTVTTLPPLGTSVGIAFDTTKPTGERFAEGEQAMVAEHVVAANGLIYIGARTADGRVLRSSFREAFALPDIRA